MTTTTDDPREGGVDVSVVLPVYNEVGHVREEIARISAALEASDNTFEIIVVDDGSTDGSNGVLRDIEGIRLVRFAQNRGSGFARRYGTRVARGNVVVWTDVDLTYPNDEIPRLVKELAGYDQVVGARTSEEGTLKALRLPAKWFVRQLASYLAKTKIPDLNSGFRAMRREVAHQFLHLLPAGFSCVTTMTMSFLANGYSVKYVPIDYSPRAGESKFHWWSDTRRYVLQVVRMVLLYNPLRAFLPPGAVLLLLGSGKLVFDLVDKGSRVATNTLVVLMAAFMMILVGLLADLTVQLNRRLNEAEPATVSDERSVSHEGSSSTTGSTEPPKS